MLQFQRMLCPAGQVEETVELWPSRGQDSTTQAAHFSSSVRIVLFLRFPVDELDASAKERDEAVAVEPPQAAATLSAIATPAPAAQPS